MSPRLEIILQHLMCAYGKYQVNFLMNNFCIRYGGILCFLLDGMQRRNLRIVYDAIGTLADAVGGELNQVMHIIF